MGFFRSPRGIPWPPRWWGLILVSLALQIVTVYGPGQKLGDEGRWLILASYCVLFAPVLANWQSWGVRIIGAGLLLNFLAVAFNGGWMPVTPEALDRAGLAHLGEPGGLGGVIAGSKDMLLAREEVRLYPLTDTLVSHLPWAKVYSPGDFVLVGGVLVVVAESIGRVALTRSRLQPRTSVARAGRLWTP